MRAKYFALYGQKVVVHGYPWRVTGREDIREYHDTLWEKFPGAYLLADIEKVKESSDQLRVKYILWAAQLAEQVGAPAGANQYIKGTTRLRFDGEHVVEAWYESGGLNVRMPLGALTREDSTPAPAPALRPGQRSSQIEADR